MVLNTDRGIYILVTDDTETPSTMTLSLSLSVSCVRRSSLAERFSAELPGLSLPQVLSTLELPRQMAELKATYSDVCQFLFTQYLHKCFVFAL